ncbi:RNA polymerase sigma-70 factor [Pedobacter nyackensis]|uniref:RNA polymerase sigma factor n=1 Tax=Pedobacter nyackensis TaxID=475255 RepID=UPI00292E6B12|nr:RNA polymerase sigma-70 factor [Pedobacter nyackensis]
MKVKPNLNTTDVELFALIVNNDMEAFDYLFNRHWEKLYRYASGILKDDVEAQDVVQEVFVSLWQRRTELDEIKSPSSYLYGAIRFKSMAYIRNNLGKNNYFESLSHFFEEGRDVINEAFDARELNELIESEIDKLPAKMKEVFRLSRMDQLSHKEIAEQLNISEKTVKKQIQLSLKYFRMVLADRSGAIKLVIIIFLLNQQH